MAWGINPPKALGELGTRAAGEAQSTAAKHNCTTLADQERMMLAASRTSPRWFFSTLHVRHIGNIGCFFLMEQNNENTWKKTNYAGQDSLIKEGCVFRCLPLFSALPYYLTLEKPGLFLKQTRGLFLPGNHIKNIAWPSSFAKLIIVLSCDPKTLRVR